MIPTIKQALEMYRAGQCTLEQALGWIAENVKLDAEYAPPEGRAIEILREIKGGIPPWLNERKIIDTFLASLPTKEKS